MMDILTDLQYRGLLYQCTDGIVGRLAQGPITLYNGFDPTAESMTVGNLVPILLLRRFQIAGHTPIALIGGGTGLIGDPSGKSEERSLNAKETVSVWSDNFRHQLESYLDFHTTSNPALIVDNSEWLGSLGAIEFMRDVGKHFPVPYMLAKDSVSARLAKGISYTEFSYMILQSYDFLQLFRTYNCELQTGGSDQWGNITAGGDLVRRTSGDRVYGLTCPLITTAEGAKFGKTEAGAIWLDANRTSPYQFYQFWINTDDAHAVPYLKIFTFLDRREIDELEEITREHPEKRHAQRRLAEEVTAIVHGKKAVAKSENISRALFYGELSGLAEDEIEQAFDDVPTHTMQGNEQSLIDLLAVTNISSSKRQARQDIQSGAIYLNGDRCTDLDRRLTRADGLHGKYLVIRRGKNKYFLIK